MADRIETYQQFWPFYLGEHSLPATRVMHFIGTTIAAVNLVGAVVWLRPSLALAALVSGYFFAWVSHFFIEKNRPATFTYPLWSFGSDWRMWALTIVGKLPAELAKYQIRPKATSALQVDKG